MVPAIDKQSCLTPINNKRRIQPKQFKDSISSNIVDKFSQNHSDCYKVNVAKTEQYRNSFFIKTVQEWNQLDECVASLPTSQGFKAALNRRD